MTMLTKMTKTRVKFIETDPAWSQNGPFLVTQPLPHLLIFPSLIPKGPQISTPWVSGKKLDKYLFSWT